MTEVRLLAWPTGAERWAEACRPSPGGDEVVVVVHRGEPPDPAVIDALLAALDGVDAAATVETVTDAVKRTDPTGLVAGSVDRDELARVGFPQAIRGEVLAALGDDPSEPVTGGPVRRLVGLGRRVRAVRPEAPVPPP